MKKIALLSVLMGLFLLSCTPQKRELATDVLVIGGTTSGTSAGIQSARLGVKTLIVEETPWLGGMMTAAGVSAIDGNHNLHSGIWNEFRDKLRSHYGGAAALETGWVSNTQFEPHVGDSILKAMASAQPELSVLHGYRVESIVKEGNRVKGAIFTNNKNEKLIITAKVTIDATDLGDGLALAGAAYDLGLESRSTTSEECAPEQSAEIVQDLTWVAILKDYGPGADKTIARPENYDPAYFKGCCSMTVDSTLIDCSKMLTYGKLPNNKYMINWPRKGNDIYLNVVNMTASQRNEELKKAKERTLQFVYYIQQELGYKHLGLADDEFPSEDKLALVPYHREGRRVKGKVRFTINEVTDRYGRNPLYRTGISVGDYPVDHHHLCKPEVAPIHFPAVPSFSIPLGSLIPAEIEGLIVSDKAISVSNIINGATRLQPCVLLTGQAAGALAALSVRKGTNPDEVKIREIQQELLNAGAYLLPTFDIAPADPDFQSIQRVAATGLLHLRGEPWKWANRSWFDPDSTITKAEFEKSCSEYNSNIIPGTDQTSLTLANAAGMISKMCGQDLTAACKTLYESRTKSEFTPDMPINRRELAIWLDQLAHPFESKEIDYTGNFIN